MATKRAKRQRAGNSANRVVRPVASAPTTLPGGRPREWLRGTELLSLFVASGYGLLRVGDSTQERVKPASIILVGDPGHGKTELLERFRAHNRQLSYHSDLTSRQFWRVLKQAKNGETTHVVATEFQKWFQRKLSVAENTLGLLVQAMEEGVYEVSVGNQSMDFGGARVGILGGVTHGTMDKRREFFAEMGFLSRASVIPWELPHSEKKLILDMQDKGITTDVEPVQLQLPDSPTVVALTEELSRRINKYVWDRWKEPALRVYNRIRTLTMSSALLDGRDVVKDSDIDRVVQFDDYWLRMVL